MDGSHRHTGRAAERVLAVVDWSVAPAEAAALLARRMGDRPGRLGIVVPSRLRGLEWVGDPGASCPCARRQLRELRELLRESGITIDAEWVGAPETVPAISDALEDWRAQEVLLLGPAGGLRHGPLALTRRVHRATRLPVVRMSASRRAGGHRGRCDAAVERAGVRRAARPPLRGQLQRHA